MSRAKEFPNEKGYARVCAALVRILPDCVLYFLNSGLLFSRNAVIPSLAASVQAISAFPR